MQADALPGCHAPPPAAASPAPPLQRGRLAQPGRIAKPVGLGYFAGEDLTDLFSAVFLVFRRFRVSCARRPCNAPPTHGPPRPSPTHHTLWGCPGWPGYAWVGRWWPPAAAPSRLGSRRWGCRCAVVWPRTPPRTARLEHHHKTAHAWFPLTLRHHVIPFDRPHTRGMPGRAREAINSLGDPHGAHGAARLPRSDSTAATNTAPRTPPRGHPHAPPAYPKRLWDPFPHTPHMRVWHAWARLGARRGRRGDRCVHV